MTFYNRLQNLDRRIVYIVVALAIAIPLIYSFDAKTYTTEPVENLYQFIDSYSGREDRAVLLSINHDASTMPELFPMEVAILRHCFERNIKVFTLCFTPVADPLIDLAISTAKEEFPDIESGTDYCNIGYIPAALYLPTILGMGDDIGEALTIDKEGRKISTLPIMKDKAGKVALKNYKELNLIIEFSGAAAGGGWITYARSMFGANVAAGVTAVMGADAYPMLQTGQLTGLLAGLKAASEYEKLVDTFAQYEDKDHPNGRKFSKEIIENSVKNNTFKISEQKNYKFKTARIGMNAQSVAHIMMIVFILLGNVGYYMQRRAEKRAEN